MRELRMQRCLRRLRLHRPWARNAEGEIQSAESQNRLACTSAFWLLTYDFLLNHPRIPTTAIIRPVLPFSAR